MMKLTQNEIMALQIDRDYEKDSFNQRLKSAGAFLPSDPRAKLDVTELTGQPQGLEPGMTAFEFNRRGLVRVYVVGETATQEIFPSGPLNTHRRKFIAQALGFRLDNFIHIPVTETGQYPRRRHYLVLNT